MKGRGNYGRLKKASMHLQQDKPQSLSPSNTHLCWLMEDIDLWKWKFLVILVLFCFSTVQVNICNFCEVIVLFPKQFAVYVTIN